MSEEKNQQIDDVHADPLNESSVLIQPTQQQQKIIEEILNESVSIDTEHPQQENLSNNVQTPSESVESNGKSSLNGVHDTNATATSETITGTESQSKQDTPVDIPQNEIVVQRYVVDAIEQARLGNLLPWAYAISSKMMSSDQKDQTGCHLLHKAAWLQQSDIIVSLIEKYNVDVDIIDDSTGQTVLMIACMHGKIKLVKYLIDKGANVNLRDHNGFSAIMNAVMNRFKPVFIYLLAKGADYTVLDQDGCTLAHRAAFNNDVDILKLIHQIDRQQFETIDRLKLAPVGRAITNESHNAFQYLQKVRPIQIPDKNYGKLQNQCMAQMIHCEYKKQHSGLCSFVGILRAYKAKSRMFCLALHAVILLVLARIVHSEGNALADSSEELTQYVQISQVFAIVLFSSIYAFLFILPCPSQLLLLSDRPRNLVKLLRDLVITSASRSSPSKIDFTHLNKLFKRGKIEESQNHTTIAVNSDSTISQPIFEEMNLCDYIYALIQTEKFDRLEQINSLSFCYECLDLQNQREHHCDHLNRCIPKYSHYSHFYGKLITQDNFNQVLIVHLFQFLGLVLFFIINYTFCREKYEFEGFTILAFFEIPFIYFKQAHWIYLLGYLVFSLCCYFLSIQLLINLTALAFRITNFELFNPQKCQEFYPIENIQKIPSAPRAVAANSIQESYLRYYTNPFSRCVNHEEDRHFAAQSN